VETNRAVSPVISVILMVAIAVILTATISVFVLGFTEDLNDTAPVVGQTSGEFVPGADEQEVLITHVAGDSVPVENIEIVVRATGPGVDSETRLVNLPAEGSDIDSVNIEGDTGIISRGYGESGPSDPNQVIIEDYPTDDNMWDAGETIQFEINVGGADFREPPNRTGPEADELEVAVVYTDTESSAILFEKTFRSN
jgi:flagellin-like protein